jgi:hypothetical protein
MVGESIMICETCGNNFTGPMCPVCNSEATTCTEKVRCADCGQKVISVYLRHGLCPDCLEAELKAPMKNPTLAALLNIVPGLGFVYLGNKSKGGIFLFMFFLCCLIPVIGWLMLPAAFIWPALAARRTAQRMNLLKLAPELVQ